MREDYFDFLGRRLGQEKGTGGARPWAKRVLLKATMAFGKKNVRTKKMGKNWGTAEETTALELVMFQWQ